MKLSANGTALRAALLIVVLGAGCGPPRVRIQAGAGVIRAEIAATAAARAQGLMYRKSMPRGDGMLFVFPDEQVRSFWMRNTQIPLSIAYLDDERRVVSIVEMQPLVENPHPSGAAAKFAVEVNQGWFREHGVAVGDTFEFELPGDLRPEP